MDYVHQKNFLNWFTDNLENQRLTETHTEWKEAFAYCLWWIWKWRNDRVFNGQELDTVAMHATLSRYFMEVGIWAGPSGLLTLASNFSRGGPQFLLPE